MDTKTKEIILQFLMENTQVESRYLGGDDISIVSLLNSEGVGYSDESREAWLSSLASQLVKQLQQDYPVLNEGSLKTFELVNKNDSNNPMIRYNGCKVKIVEAITSRGFDEQKLPPVYKVRDLKTGNVFYAFPEELKPYSEFRF